MLCSHKLKINCPIFKMYLKRYSRGYKIIDKIESQIKKYKVKRMKITTFNPNIL